jgi:hypothetical protein
MRLLKTIHISLALLFTFISFKTAAQGSLIFYRDTTITFNGLIIGLHKTFFNYNVLKTIVKVNNLTDSFIVFNPANIILVLPNGTRIFNTSLEEIIIAPYQTKKFNLKYHGKFSGNTMITFDFSQYKISDKILAEYQFHIPARAGEEYNIGSLKLRVHDCNLDPSDYAVQLKIYYAGRNLLGIFTDNVYMRTNDGSIYVNLTKRWRKPYFDNEKPHQTINLVFKNPEPYQKGHEPLLIFKNVFKEYSFITVEGSKITQHITSQKFNVDDRNEIKED